MKVIYIYRPVSEKHCLGLNYDGDKENAKHYKTAILQALSHKEDRTGQETFLQAIQRRHRACKIHSNTVPASRRKER